VPSDKVFIERFVLPEPAPAVDHVAVAESLVVRLEHRETTLDYNAGDTLLEAARRGGLSPPFSCEQGNCATCMAHLEEGTVTMRVNNALSVDEVEDGWVLTCQSLPTAAKVVVDYDA
ncbi:MAG TPA: 2Fe-2S iron-sulfur cluster binding domain-containing protein, partial [Acidimicrobiia bacterium]|nr:2Fe-2S iron-sulfur cluster binding domain-containing protein [Acidimicrobiia bacterium]